MSNELSKSGNPWEAYGNAVASRSIIGDLLKFSRGDYTAGMDDREIAVGTQLVAVMDSLCVGWIKWADNRPVEQQMGLVIENFQPSKRKELGDLDESNWETDDEGRPRNPWQFSDYLVLVTPDGAETFTFATSSRGGLNAVGELCKAFGKQVRQKPDEYPLIKLGVGSYQHRVRSYGRIKFPVFEIVGWTGKAPFAGVLDDGGGSSSGGGNAAALEKPAGERPQNAEPRF